MLNVKDENIENSILEKARSSKTALLLKSGIELGLTEKNILKIIKENGLDGSKSLDAIVTANKKSDNAKASGIN